jgi:hypothetical protein
MVWGGALNTSILTVGAFILGTRDARACVNWPGARAVGVRIAVAQGGKKIMVTRCRIWQNR